MVETLEDLCDGCAAIETIKTPEYPRQNKFQSAVMLIGALVLPAQIYTFIVVPVPAQEECI